MQLRLTYRAGDGSPCRVLRDADAWCFRQEDRQAEEPCIRVFDPAVPLVCDWLRRALHHDDYRALDVDGLLSGPAPTMLIPRHRCPAGVQETVRLSLEDDTVHGRIAVLTARGCEQTVRFDLSEARHLLSLLEGSILWAGIAHRWEQIPPFRACAIAHDGRGAT